MYAYTLTPVKVSEIIDRAKGSSGLSVRAMAGRAQVAASTITRIRAGTLAPTLPLVERLVDAAGYDLQLELRRSGTPRTPRLGNLADAWSRQRGRVRLDWTRWRAFLDDMSLHPDRVPDAIYVPPPPAGEKIIDALLAAVAEKLAEDAGLPAPAWCVAAPSLDEPYEPRVARQIPGRTVPPQLARRGLLIDAESLWRDRADDGE